MQVVIDEKVYEAMYDFYAISCRVHETLGYETCIRKTDRLEAAMRRFARYAEIFHNKPYKREWQEKGYSEFVSEGFHFAYRIYKLPDGEKVLRFHDAVHSTLNYNPEDK